MKTLFLLSALVFLSAMKLPEGFKCSGTEPFWGFPSEEWTPGKMDVSGFAGRPPSAGFILRGKGSKGESLALTYIPATGCSDGMSDRKYLGYGVFDNGREAYYGCCLPDGKAP